MVTNELITAVFILLGAGLMVLSALSTRNIFILLKGHQTEQSWRRLLYLMIFFAVGYLVVLWMVITDRRDFLLTLMGLIFLFGALFVLFVVRLELTTIQELSAMQKALVKARDEALAHSQLKTELLARVSHELRTPLHSILGYTEILNNELHGPLVTKQKDIIERIAVNAHRLVSHINHLLQQARLEAGEVAIENKPMAPQALLDYVDLLISPLAEQKGLMLSCQLDPQLPPTLMGDIYHLQEIMTNLIGNAVKFTEQGHIQVKIDKVDAAHWGIHVKDTGPGIPEEQLKAIFNPFQQVDGSIRRKYGGTGLGLSIAKQVTELMNGELNVQSTVGEGSHFAVLLPLLS